MELALDRFAEIREDLGAMMARDSHELMRAMEIHSILDCAEMATHASLFRTESRWGLYHWRVDYPETDHENWFCFSQIKLDIDGRPTCFKRPVDPYVVPVDVNDNAYYRQRIAGTA
jgi:succinate dehydrogenase/fumarate reductase flavoprotein subunit